VVKGLGAARRITTTEPVEIILVSEEIIYQMLGRYKVGPRKTNCDPYGIRLARLQTAFLRLFLPRETKANMISLTR
jgi:hypothetical protein